jgi:hypothetical protein
MKFKILLILFLFVASKTFSQEHKNKCNLKVVSAEPVVWNDKLKYYKVVILNENEKTMDACEWTASFYDKFDVLIGEAVGKWSSGSIIGPVQPGEKMIDRETPKNIGDADKIFISINKAHFIDDSICQ